MLRLNRGAIADLHAELEKEPYGEGAAIYRIKAKDYGWGQSNECRTEANQHKS